MISRLFHALVAASVVAGAAVAADYGVQRLPDGAARRSLERWIAAPGRAVYERARRDPSLGPGLARAEAETRRLSRLYAVGTWASTGLALCLILTLILGISSLRSALALGLKVTLALACAQGALLLGGMLER